MYTRREWCYDWLVFLGNLQPSTNVVKWVAAWTLLETAPPPHVPAQFNLLNTRHTEGVLNATTNYNDAGVKNFATYQDGLQGNASALRDGFYPAILKALLNNDEMALGLPPATTYQNDIYLQLSKWCGGCGYGTKLLDLLGKNMDDSFIGVRQPPVVAKRVLLINVQVLTDGSIRVLDNNGSQIF